MNERTTTRSTHILLYDARRENFSRLRRKESREEILEKKNGTRCEYRSSERGGVSTAIRCVFALKIRFFFFPSLVAFSLVKFFLSSVLSLSLSLFFCCCYLRMMIISLFFDVAFGRTSGVVVFSRSRKREKEYIWGWWFSSSLKRKERDELRRRSHSRNPIEEPTHSEVILISSLSLLIFFLKQQTGCPRRLGGDEIGQSLGLSPVCPDDSNTHRRFISRVSKVGRRHRQSRETTHVRGNRKRAIRVSTVGKWNHVFTVSHE